MRRVLYVSAFVRAAATSTAGVTMGGFLGVLGARGLELGAVISAGLAGGAVAAILTRRRSTIVRCPPTRRPPHLVAWIAPGRSASRAWCSA